MGLAFLLTGGLIFLRLSSLFDLLRYGFWYAFFLALLQLTWAQRTLSGIRWLLPLSGFLVTVGLASMWIVALRVLAPVDAGRVVLMVSMAAPVWALILLEQVFRNVNDDARWNIKPLGLGLVGAFLFDLYLFSFVYLQ